MTTLPVESDVGLPDLPYFTGDPVYADPFSRPAASPGGGEAAGKNKSPVFC